LGKALSISLLDGSDTFDSGRGRIELLIGDWKCRSGGSRNIRRRRLSVRDRNGRGPRGHQNHCRKEPRCWFHNHLRLREQPRPNRRPRRRFQSIVGCWHVEACVPSCARRALRFHLTQKAGSQQNLIRICRTEARRSQLIREYIHLYGAVCPQYGACVYLIMPTSNTACFQSFLNVLSRRFARQDILLVLDGAPNHRCHHLAVPRNITLLFLPPYAPGLNPKESLWDEIREKIFKNYALKSIDAVYAKLNEAIGYINRNPKLVKSITSFPYIVVILMWKRC
jgi:transposase